MPTLSETGFDRERCHRRNRLAARRDGVEATPVRFLKEPPAPAEPGEHLLTSVGELPATHEEEMARINALLPGGESPLYAHDVYVHYLEAANDNFVADRYVFLDGSTLKNIATDAAAGVAFMNSHRDGGLSQPSELPFGKTFAGRYEEYLDEAGQRKQRTLVGFYMLKGVLPNGAGGPSTDALDRMISGGTVFDVSVGLRGGERICDVCGNPVGAYDRKAEQYLCNHLPGSNRKMDAEQQAAQLARGVPKGKASYSLTEARMGEVSAVYDGAVPGAGFRKATALARMGALSEGEVAEACEAYRSLFMAGDFDTSERFSADWGPTADDEEVRPAAPARGLRMNLAAVRDKTTAFFSQLFGQLEEENAQAEGAAAGSNADAMPAQASASSGGGGARSDHKQQDTSRPTAPDPAVAAQIAALQTELAAQRAEVEAQKAQVAAHEQEVQDARARAIDTEAKAFADQMVREKRATPGQKEEIITSFRLAAVADQSDPMEVAFGRTADGQEQKGSRVDVLRSMFAKAPQHVLMEELLGTPPSKDAPPLAVLLSRTETDRPDEEKPPTQERKAYLHSLTAEGKAFLADRASQNGGSR